MKKPNRLYKIVAGVLPIEHRFVLIQFGDGATWLVRGTVAVDLATEYNWENRKAIARGDPDRDYAKLVVRKRTKKDWKEYAVYNEDLVQAVLEEQWGSVGAVHIRGPRSDVPKSYKCWWIRDNGGTLTEVSDIPPHKQRRLGIHWFDRSPGVAEDGKGRCEASVPVWKNGGRA